MRADETEIEEPESRDRYLRNKVNTFLNNSDSGKAIDILVALFSLFTSLTFVVLTYYDLRHLNPCCNEALQKFEEHKIAAANGEEELRTENDFMLEHGVCEGDDPPCYEYYHNNRMPQIFDWIDKPVCVIYAVHYFLKLYIAVNRC